MHISHLPISTLCRHLFGGWWLWIDVRLSASFCKHWTPFHPDATDETRVQRVGDSIKQKTPTIFLIISVFQRRSSFSEWSWAESNRRPNKRLTCFLHAYSVIGCRGDSGRGHPRPTVASKNSPALRGFMPAIPSLRAPPNHMPTVGACGRCLVPTTVAGIKLTYCASVMQQERSYFRQLNLVHRWSRLLMREPACLQIHLLAVKTSQPQE